MSWTKGLHIVVLILCCLSFECEGFEAVFGEKKNISVVSGEELQLTCNDTSGPIDPSKQRRWYENNAIIVSGGTVANPNSGYSEKVEGNAFTLTIPAVNISFDGNHYTCTLDFDQADFYLSVRPKPTATEGSTTESTTINLSTDFGTTTNSETSSKLSTESVLPYTQSVSLSESTIEGNTLPGSTESDNTKSETSTAPVETSSPGLTEEMIIIISIVGGVGGIFLVVITVIVVFCCIRRNGVAKSEKHRNKHGKSHNKDGNNEDLNSNYEQSQKMKHSTHSASKIHGGTDFNQNHSQKNILYGGRMPTGVEYPRPQNYHQQNYPRNQHHYRNQNSAYYLPYTDPRNVIYYQRYPGSEYSEDLPGYSRGGPYRMQQFYLQSYPRQDRYTDDGLERKIGHRRGDYGSYWDNDNDTLY